MQIDQLQRLLDEPRAATSIISAWGVEDAPRGHGNLVRMATTGLTLDLLAVLCGRLSSMLPQCSDAGMALNNLDRFFASQRNPLSLGSLFERDSEALSILLQIFSTSQHLSDLLILDPAAYDLVRLTEGQPVRRELLAEEMCSEVEALADETAVMSALRRFKRRETLRIAYGDIVRGLRLDLVTSQISHLADAIVEAAVRYAWRTLESRRGVPRAPGGRRARFVVLGMGKLGGVELNYSSDIDLIFLYDQDGKTDGARPQSNAEFFDRLAREVVRLLTETTDLGAAYRVDLRLRPEGERGPPVHSVERACHYYDVLGRTWERQAYVKARPIAGDFDLGAEFLSQLEPWIYRRYLSLADITGIKALKRRIEHRTASLGDDARNVKTGHGGIRDVEFAIQFLQLLNGGDLPQLRTTNTLEAIAKLEQVGCLTHQERTLLEENYGFLRKIEHRLQIMFDLQTHLLPVEPQELQKLARRMGYRDTSVRTARAAFEADYQAKTAVNRRILDHLLHDAFGEDAQTEPEVDLVLDPAPPVEVIDSVLGRYPFVDIPLAHKNLTALASERIRFLSTRRCRHFLASIAPRLLKAIAETPDPDTTLTNLEKVSDSLGGKGILWELFSFNPPTMNLYVELCATSPYLSSLLISNPGMIDELMDSLVLNKLPSKADMRSTLAELSRGAQDLDPILQSFKTTHILRVGVRDVLGKEDIQATMGALSDLAETCLEKITFDEYSKLVLKLGQPTIGEGPEAGRPCGMVVLAMGKLGGRELDYRSDLDLIFLYEADGPTVAGKRSRPLQTTNNQHFFSELGQRIIRVASRAGPQGRLYEVDPRLRPTGKSGTLATSFGEFSKYFADGLGQLWERQALCKARVVASTHEAELGAEIAIARAAFHQEWRPEHAAAIRAMRARMEEGAAPGNLKRAAGGIVDIEFAVQLLQLKHGPDLPEVRVPNTLAAIDALARAGCMSDPDSRFLAENYRFLRSLQSRMRLLVTTGRNDLPDEPLLLAQLAHALGYASGKELAEEVRLRMQVVRARFLDLVTRAGRETMAAS